MTTKNVDYKKRLFLLESHLLWVKLHNFDEVCKEGSLKKQLKPNNLDFVQILLFSFIS